MGDVVDRIEGLPRPHVTAPPPRDPRYDPTYDPFADPRVTRPMAERARGDLSSLIHRIAEHPVASGLFVGGAAGAIVGAIRGHQMSLTANFALTGMGAVAGALLGTLAGMAIHDVSHD